MKFKKEDLHFLNLFASYSDNSINGDKLRVLIEDDKIYFCQIGLNSKLIYTIENTNNIENTEYIFITSQLNSLIKMCKDESDIEIKEGSIIFNNDAKYKLTNFDYTDVHPKSLIEAYNTSFTNKSITTITDLEKLNKIKPFIGKDRGYNTVAIMDSHFVTYNNFVLSFIDTNNQIKTGQIVVLALSLLQYFNLDDFHAYDIEEDFDCIKIDNLYAFFEKGKHQIPDIFNEENKELYEHTNKVVIKTELLKQKAKRLNVVSKTNIDNKVYLTCNKGQLILETKDEPIGREIIEAEVDHELEDFYVITFGSVLVNVLSQIKEEYTEIHLTPDKENISTILIKGQDGIANYVMVLVEY